MGATGFRLFAAAALSLLSACQTSHGGDIALAPAALTAQAAPAMPASDAMPTGTPMAKAPGPYLAFCNRDPEECTFAGDQPDRLHLSGEAWTLLASVNTRINAAVTNEDDVSHFGSIEYWTLPTDGSGDCEDYALAKRKELIAAGLPAKALRVAIVVTMRDFRHAVLTVSTDRGDYVLDNATGDILPWRQAGYLWLARQDPSRALGWVTP